MATKNVKMQFGGEVRQLRLEKGWSQEELAHYANLDRSYIGGVERGERNVSIENICKISKALGCSPATFFNWWNA
jgi:transcriptional regulator with XRE-family HTH domain